jgi:uncharacterized protein (DUF2252 family)
MAPAQTDARSEVIIEVLRDAFAPLMRADPAAFRAKYRKMARDPHAFYRGSACLFFNDVTGERDEWAAHGAERIWIHGDLHVENFGTYLNSDGRLVFDINDFDEAYVGRFTWDLQRFAASLALVGWQKALPDDAIRKLIARYARSYLAQVNHYVASDTDDDFEIRLEKAEGPVLTALVAARAMRRADLLDEMTYLAKGSRRFIEDGSTAASSARSGPRWSRRSAPTSTPSPSRSGSTARSSTSCVTSWASPASASAVPACRPTTCWSRATARRSTTTSC